jgi:hypothetical protein
MARRLLPPILLRRLVLPALLLALAGAAEAGEWGGIEPGVSTVEQVRERWGAPSKETRARVEGYDTMQWVYEGNRAPGGLQRMTVDFGLLTPAGYRPSLVRLLKLEPKPHMFGRQTVIQGWGIPDGLGTQDGFETFFYRLGVFIIFDKAGEDATTLIFSVPQPDLAPARSAPASPPAQPRPPAPAPPAGSPRR